MCEVEAVSVSWSDKQEDVNKYLALVANAIPRDQEVQITVDVTHGYRHFAFLTYVAVLHLSALRGIRVRGAYYGLLQDKVSPFLDLQPLLELPLWYHALQTLGETGSALALAELLESRFPDSHFARDLEQISQAYLSGLPLELGQQVHEFLRLRPKPLKKLLRAEGLVPLSDELVDRLAEILAPFGFPQPVSGGGWKSKFELGDDELLRQARFIDDLLQRDSFATALGLMNEWTISWVTCQIQVEGQWLDRGQRGRAANLLGAIAAVGKDPDLQHLLTDDQRALGEFWHLLSELRNAYHHHGMRAQVLVGNPGLSAKLERVLAYWQNLCSCPGLSLELGESGSSPIVVSPIGRRPGVLFSALQACRASGAGEPGTCLVICSPETEELAAEALARAEYKGQMERLPIDPYGNAAEIGRVAQEARRHLVGATTVFVNVTGGTTLMGLAAEAIAKEAHALACPVRRFGLIDRRSAEA